MMPKIVAEFIGTLGLLLIVVGSGIMAETLSQGNLAIALLANSIATGAGLFTLIKMFGPISGAHFNPVVSMVSRMNHELSTREFISYVAAQFVGAVFGVGLAHLLFSLPLLQISTHDRSGLNLGVSEFVATFGLMMVIGLTHKKDPRSTAASVACYITAAYWFTSSTSFANPAVTVARSMTHTFAGIAPNSILVFVFAQFVGAIFAMIVSKFLNKFSSPT